MGKTLVVAEKPDAARTIAKVLGVTEKKQGYMENDDYIITWAIGHLVGLKDPQDHNEEYKKWSLEDLPFSFPISNSLKVLPNTSSQFKVIKKLINRSDVDLLVNAGDAGREGLLIQEWIYRMCGNKHPKKLLWADSLAETTIKNAFANLKDYTIEFQNLLAEAEARAEGDWSMGINYSRALTLTKGTGKGPLTYGRCQTPLLNLICMRDEEIANFVPKPYFQVQAKFVENFEAYHVDIIKEEGKATKYNRTNYDDRKDAESIVSNCQNGPCKIIDYKQTKKTTNAPLLLDLATLQKQMGAKYGYTADKTLEIAQTLYEKYKILSYPRTDSRYLTKDIFGEIQEHINACKFGKFEKIVDHIKSENVVLNQYYNDRKVTDHHALIPNMGSVVEQVYPSLTDEERHVFDAVVLSFLAIFYPPYKYMSTEIVIDINGESFYAKGNTPISKGFKLVLKGEDKDNKDEEQALPELQIGDSLNIDEMNILDKVTTPPPKYTVSSIIELMEKHHIGTPATRAEIIQKILKRKYIVLTKSSYSSTEYGRNFIKCIPEQLKTPNLTKHFEEQLQLINEGTLKKDIFLAGILEDIKEDIEQFKKEDTKVSGSRGDSIGKCPICGEGDIVENSKAYGCSNWKNGCKCTIWKVMSGKKISPKMVKDLLDNGKTKTIKGFKYKSGTEYDGYLQLEEDGNVKVVNPNFTPGDPNASKNVIGKCPICGGEIIENAKAYGCSNWKDGCKCTIWKTSGGIDVTPEIARELIENKKTSSLTLQYKNGNTYNGHFELDDTGVLSIVNDDGSSSSGGGFASKNSLGKCPICGKGDVVENSKAFGCSNWKNGCKFTVWKNMSGKEIKEQMVQKLLEKGKTGIIKGFKTKDGSSFEGYLKIDEDNGVKVIRYTPK